MAAAFARRAARGVSLGIRRFQGRGDASGRVGDGVPGAKGAVVLPYWHGVAIPDDSPHVASSNAVIWTSHYHMPFFAGMYGKATYLAICQTPHDTSIDYEHVADKPPTVCFRSYSPMGAPVYPSHVAVCLPALQGLLELLS